MSLSLPQDLPGNYTYHVIGDGQFRVREIDNEESALVSYCKTWTNSQLLKTKKTCPWKSSCVVILNIEAALSDKV